MTPRDVPAGPRRLLLIAADGAARARLRAALERAVAGCAVQEVDDLDRAFEPALRDDVDAVVVDHVLGGARGVDLVGALRARGVAAPILLACERADDDLERAAAAAGAADVVTRDDLVPARLARRLAQVTRLAHADAAAARVLARTETAASARDELLAVVSHDLRSPLNAIVLACDALDADVLTDSERHRYVGAVRRAGQRAERLLRDLLDVSRIDSGALRLEVRPSSARSILEQTRAEHELLARGAGSDLVVDLDGDPGQVLADRDRLVQALANLVGNAIKYAPGAPITLAARGEPGAVVLSVADRGPGIAPDQLPHVFDRFWQGGRSRRRGGAGLGLTIVKGIVEAHGGTITVESEPGHGARFALRLPRPAGA